MAGEKGGYGLVYSEIMRSKKLSPEAKAIYAYLCAFAGSGDTCFPSVELMREELQMSNDRFYRHLRPLLLSGIVKKAQERSGNRWGRTVYKLNHRPDFQLPQNQYTENEDTEKQSPQIENTENLQTNNTSLNSTSYNNTSYNTSIAQALFDMFNEAKAAASFKGRLKEYDTGVAIVRDLVAVGISSGELMDTAKDFIIEACHPAEINWHRFNDYCRKKYHLRSR